MTNLIPHILIYSDDADLGGVAQFDHALALGLRRANYLVSVVKPMAQPHLRTDKIYAGVNCLELGFDPTKEFGRTLRDEATPSRIIDALHPSLFVFSDCSAVSNLAAKRAAIRLGVPFIVVIGFVAPHVAQNFAAYLDQVAEFFKAAKAVFAVSRENLQLLHALFGLAAERGEVIHGGRPEQYFAPVDVERRTETRRQLGLSPDDILCVTTARLEEVKGHALQLAALTRLRETPVWQRLHFAWIGAGTLDETLKQEAKALGVLERIHFLGQRWDIPAWLDAADIFLLPSYAEGMPLSVMEAMAKAVPVAATAVSGVPEELGDTGGLLPDPSAGRDATVAAIADTIIRWSSDASLRRAVGAAGRARAERLFREETMLRKYLGIINSAMLPEGDYVAAGLSIVFPDAAFPNLVVGVNAVRQSPHNHYVDQRQPEIGLVNRDEASILYNTALRFRGRDALEIGGFLGWSTCHLALGGVWLDVVDPLLDRPHIRLSAEESLTAAGVRRQVNLIAARSPDAIIELHRRRGRGWDLIFIDGDHDADGPYNDAVMCERYAAADAAVLFHDLALPAVARGLDYFRDRGWKTAIYRTAHIMGVAWRGAVEPVTHAADPTVTWT